MQGLADVGHGHGSDVGVAHGVADGIGGVDEYAVGVELYVLQIATCVGGDAACEFHGELVCDASVVVEFEGVGADSLYACGGKYLLLEGALYFLQGDVGSAAAIAVVVEGEVECDGLGESPAVAQVVEEVCASVAYGEAYLLGKGVCDDDAFGDSCEFEGDDDVGLKGVIEFLQEPKSSAHHYAYCKGDDVPTFLAE